ncbi:hypothetical protein SEVIR_8G130400v4 [Setaria viridis]|uniref:Phytocyanin domain-containing protein n=1 Tax=Setaria viridis TaxID=4556 RepID=A0A4U6THW3_SETVI|nr:hypothetical protein SEVIR_8G130400v2 [Setaria viridis]
MPAMANPAVMFIAVILAIVSTAAASNATASPAKNTTAPLPPFATNHAVGDGAGWFFDWKANASAANYSAWAANRTFYLGDYLSMFNALQIQEMFSTTCHIATETLFRSCNVWSGFKTDTSNTVVHTTNATAYKLCSAGVAANGSSGWKAEEAFLAVMLTAEGANYFFSDAGDGEHCRKGVRFEVAVAHGRGLPSVPASYYEPLSGAPAGMPDGWAAAAMWGALAVAVLVL